MAWYDDGMRFVTGGSDGKVYEWIICDNVWVVANFVQKYMTKILTVEDAEIVDIWITSKQDIFVTTSNQMLYKIPTGGQTGIQRKFSKL